MSFASLGARAGERRGYVDADGRQLHYRVRGEGRPLILIHQAPWSSIQYAAVMPLLAQTGFRVVAPDLPGHGMSDPLVPATIEGFAETLLPLLDALGIERAAIVGHHGGALVAARLAAHRPARVAALVLDNAPLYTVQRRSERAAMIDATEGPAPGGAHFTERWNQVRRIGDPEWSDATVHLALMTFYANGASREDGHRAALSYDLEADLPLIRCPAGVIASRTDPLFATGRLLTERRPDWSYAELPGGSGMVFERPEAWVAAVVPFLQEAH